MPYSTGRRNRTEDTTSSRNGKAAGVAIAKAGPRRIPAGHSSGERHYAQELERINGELRRANRELEEFAFVASHDLREPLRMVNIYTQLLIRESAHAATDQMLQYANHIESSVTRMEQLIQDVLHYSQVIHEAREENVVPVPLRQALDRAIAVFGDRLDPAFADIEIGSLPAVAADEMQLSVVFQNLFSNALKYAHAERKLQIQIWAESDGDLWTTYFADNGIGFEPEFAERIFGLFKRLHGRDVPGTGLGLAICRRIIERSGGIMRADGYPGRGATFMFSLKGKNHNGSRFADTSGRGQSR